MYSEGSGWGSGGEGWTEQGAEQGILVLGSGVWGLDVDISLARIRTFWSLCRLDVAPFGPGENFGEHARDGGRWIFCSTDHIAIVHFSF